MTNPLTPHNIHSRLYAIVSKTQLNAVDCQRLTMDLECEVMSMLIEYGDHLTRHAIEVIEDLQFRTPSDDMPH